jgi:hypothetical protein
MEENRLQSKTGLVAERPSNNEPPDVEQQPETETERPQYRELVAAPPLPPVRMEFVPPIQYDGKTYTEIVCDFEKLIGADFIRCEREFKRTNKAEKDEFLFAQMDSRYHAILISEASDTPRGLIKKLPGRYFTALQTEALKVCGSSAEEKKA